MLHLAIRQIKHEWARSLLTAFAISASIGMILVLRGFEQGLYVQSEKVVLDRGGQLILTQSGVSNFLAVRSSLPQLTRRDVEAIAGVKAVHPISGFWVIYGKEGDKYPLLLLVYDTLGGPTNIVEGHPIQDSHEVVIDKGLSKRFDLKPGDPLIISDFEFRIAGITQGSSALFSTFAFVTYDGMIDLILESEIAPDITTFPLLSFLLVETKPGINPSIVADRIERGVPEVDVYSPAALAQNDVELGQELFGPIMSVLIYLSYIIGMLVIGLIIYSDVSGRRRNFAVMKALGFRVKHIAKGVLVQNMLHVLIAYPVGVVLAVLISLGIERSMPVYLVDVTEPDGLAMVFFGVLIMVMAGGLMPLRFIAKTDPMTAFREE
jgi:putative ABC transport system permease protein